MQKCYKHFRDEYESSHDNTSAYQNHHKENFHLKFGSEFNSLYIKIQ